MRLTLLTALVLTGCTASTDGGGKDDTAADTAEDTDTDVTLPVDRDDDGYPASVDCDESRADVNPGVEADICNGIDDDCDGQVDEDPDLAWYLDADGDGFGNAGASSFIACAPDSDAYAGNEADCDDGDALVFPGASETCDGQDNDCNGLIDENEAEWSSYFRDDDGDGAGVNDPVYGCDAESAGGADNTYDCDDADPDEPVFVTVTGRASNSGHLESPLGSVQDAIGLASLCVVVGAGTYTEDIDFGGRNILVRTIDGSAYSTLQGTGRGPVVTFSNGEGPEAVLNGFTITGGVGDSETTRTTSTDGYTYVNTYQRGGGIYIVESSPTLDDLVVTENLLPNGYGYWDSSTTYVYGGAQGGGLYVSDGAPTLTDVDFIGNSAQYGSAIYQEGSGTLTGTRVRVEGNTGDFGSIYAVYAGQDWENLLVNANTTTDGYGGLVAGFNTITLRNSAIVDSEIGIYTEGSTFTIDSSVIYGNEVGLLDGAAPSASWRLTYNDIDGNGRDYYDVDDVTGLDGNIAANPYFGDFTSDGVSNDDLTLGSRSPLRDAGNPDAARNDRDDSVNDIGPYGGPESY